MWRQRPQRPPPTYENVCLVAEVLSRINPDLIERHFGLSADTAKQFMERLVQEKRFGDLRSDGWHYPPIRKLRLQRSRVKTKATNEPKTENHIADEPELPDELARRIDELEQEGHVLRGNVERLQDAGKIVIDQREEWKARALAAEEQMETERNRCSQGQ